MKLKMFSDGGSRGNAGVAGVGVYITSVDDDSYEEKLYQYIGIKTNNEAEYEALIRGLRFLIEVEEKIDVSEVELRCYLDSLLVVNQMNGVWKIRDKRMREKYNFTKNLADQFKKIEFIHVPREENEIADMLANKAMDEHENK
jgi:ribonuclease HI